MTETVLYKYSAHYFPLDFGSESLQRRKKELVRFRSRLQDNRSSKDDDKIVLQRVNFEISRERQGLSLQSRKIAKETEASEKPIETTAESSFTSFLGQRASFSGLEAANRATKSPDVPRHIKIGRRTFFERLL